MMHFLIALHTVRQFVVLRLTQESADKAAAAGAICSVEINTDFADKAQQW